MVMVVVVVLIILEKEGSSVGGQTGHERIRI